MMTNLFSCDCALLITGVGLNKGLCTKFIQITNLQDNFILSMG